VLRHNGLMTTCPECGFTYGDAPRHELGALLRVSAGAYAPRLAPDPAMVRRRRSPEEWSPLEYSCHTRDVMLMQRDRVYVALVEDEPSFKPMYRNERVAFDRYDTQTPDIVADQLVMAADLLSGAFDGLADEQWARPLIYGFPDPARRDVEWVAHHSLHELVHHLVDVDRILRDE
jgi:S-DNA-T family DNA segregation ATPase FtsK/SpoIIIE